MASTQNRAMEFVAELDSWADDLGPRLDELFLNTVLLFFQNIVVGGNYSSGTPIDTGYAVNSWVVGIGGVGEFRQPATDPNPPKRSADQKGGQVYSTVSFAEGQTALLDVTAGDEVHISSNCEYIAALEDGHSQQAPTGFIWLAILAAQQIVDEVAREMLR